MIPHMALLKDVVGRIKAAAPGDRVRFLPDLCGEAHRLVSFGDAYKLEAVIIVAAELGVASADAARRGFEDTRKGLAPPAPAPPRRAAEPPPALDAGQPVAGSNGNGALGGPLVDLT